MWTPGYVDAGKWFDAETCPNPVPDGFDGAFVYAGGSSAAHAWTDAELQLVAHLPRFPIWVPTPGTDDPNAVAREFVAWLRLHGVPSITQNGGRPVHVVWDMETGREPDAAWLDVAAGGLVAAGYWNLVYGSKSTVFGQPARDGLFVADYTGQFHLYAAPHVRLTQYAADVRVPGGLIDEDAVARDLAQLAWLPA